MNNNKTENNRKQAKTQAPVQRPEPKARTIKLGIDVHLDRPVVVRIIDGGTPQPPQRFEPVELMLWVAKQITLAEKVFTCCEAGPFGYSLHRKLEKMDVTNYVVRPRDWDEYGQKVKTNKRDAKQLALHLDRYVNGNHDAFCVVRVPTPEQEQERSISRQRAQLWRCFRNVSALSRRSPCTGALLLPHPATRSSPKDGRTLQPVRTRTVGAPHAAFGKEKGQASILACLAFGVLPQKSGKRLDLRLGGINPEETEATTTNRRGPSRGDRRLRRGRTRREARA